MSSVLDEPRISASSYLETSGPAHHHLLSTQFYFSVHFFRIFHTNVTLSVSTYVKIQITMWTFLNFVLLFRIMIGLWWPLEGIFLHCPKFYEDSSFIKRKSKSLILGSGRQKRVIYSWKPLLSPAAVYLPTVAIKASINSTGFPWLPFLSPANPF